MYDMEKKFFFEEETTTIKKRKGYVIIGTEFTQVYDAFSEITPKIKSPITTSLLFWLLSHEANKNNNITSGHSVYDRFCKHLVDNGGNSPTERTFHSCFDELVKIGAATKVGRGHYYVNPHFFWRGDKKERIDFIIDETKENKFKSLNPANEKNKPKLLPLKKK